MVACFFFTAGVSDFVCSAAVSGTAGARVDHRDRWRWQARELSSRALGGILHLSSCPNSVTRGIMCTVILLLYCPSASRRTRTPFSYNRRYDNNYSMLLQREGQGVPHTPNFKNLHQVLLKVRVANMQRLL